MTRKSPRLSSVDSKVLVLAGPTASGKSELAVELAHAVGGAVVCADSRQVYRGLEIGSAQPDERLRGRAPHFLFGFLSPAASYSAGDYGADARNVVRALHRRRMPAVLCGGTGLYLRAALWGTPGGAPERARAAGAAARRSRRAELARRWRDEGPEAMHAELARVDARLASRLHPRDRQRVLRGLEFHGEHGRSLSETWCADERVSSIEDAEDGATRARIAGAARSNEGAPLLFRLELATDETERRIAARLEQMIGAGLVEEARALFERYGSEPLPSLTAVGYAELFAHLRGEVGLDQAVTRMLLRTRQYAKRQRTWFRHQDGYVPVPAGEGALQTLLACWRPRLG